MQLCCNLIRSMFWREHNEVHATAQHLEPLPVLGLEPRQGRALVDAGPDPLGTARYPFLSRIRDIEVVRWLLGEVRFIRCAHCRRNLLRHFTGVEATPMSGQTILDPFLESGIREGGVDEGDTKHLCFLGYGY